MTTPQEEYEAIRKEAEIHKEVVIPNKIAVRQKFLSKNEKEQAAKIGYITKASEHLPFPVQLIGITYNAIKGKYHYAARIDYGTWDQNNQAIRDLNEEGAYNRAGFDKKATFPHGQGFGVFEEHKPGKEHKSGNKADQLKMLFENKDILGIKDDWIHGKLEYSTEVRRLNCANGCQEHVNKNSEGAGFATWKLDHLVL